MKLTREQRLQAERLRAFIDNWTGIARECRAKMDEIGLTDLGNYLAAIRECDRRMANGQQWAIPQTALRILSMMRTRTYSRAWLSENAGEFEVRDDPRHKQRQLFSLRSIRQYLIRKSGRGEETLK